MKSEVQIIIVILIVVVIILGIKFFPQKGVSEELAKCIGENSQLYTLSTCVHCKTQKKLFGENVKYLNITVCDENNNLQKCEDILGIEAGFPTWIIKNEKYLGVQKIEQLKNLTGC